MIYPTAEYAYVDENGQSVESPRFVQHVYAENNDQPSSSSHLVYDNNSYDNQQQQQQVQYRPIVINGSQPL